MCYRRTLCVPRRKLYTAVIKNNLLMFCIARFAVCSATHTKKKNKSHVEFLNVKPCGT